MESKFGVDRRARAVTPSTMTLGAAGKGATLSSMDRPGTNVV